MTKTPTESPQELRQRAEEQYRLDCTDKDGLPGGLPPGTQNLLHELRVHQIELEMQSEDLRRSQLEIETARARYFDLYDLAPIGYLTFSENGLIREANLAAATMIGVVRRNLLKRPMTQFIFPEDQDVYFLHRKKLLEFGEPVEWDMRMLHADGSSYWVHLNANLMQDGSYQIAFSDISRRKQTDDVQAFLARSGSGVTSGEPFFNTLACFLAQNLDMDFVCIDRLEGDWLTARTVAVWCDGHFEDNVTYTLNDTPCGDVVGKDICCFPASVCQIFPRDQVLLDLRAESYVGVTLWSHLGQPIGLIALIGRKPLTNRSLAETVLKMVAVRAADELERLEVERSLKESESRWKFALEGAGDGVWDWNIQTGEALYSRRYKEMLGFAENEIGNSSDEWSRRIHPEDIPGAMAALQPYLDGKTGPVKIEFRMLCKDGNWKWILGRGMVVSHDSDGKPMRMIGTNTDITDRKQAEQQLHAKNSEMERFTYTVSHDLKSPLITIQSYAGMILKEMEAGRYERAMSDIRRIEDAAGKMNALLNDLLELSRIGRQMNESIEVDMNRLARDVLEQLAGPLKQSKVNVVLQPDLPALHGDQKRLAEVLQNLIENAIKYRGDQSAPRIEIGTRRDGREPVFFVSDNGKGIEPRHHERIFGLFNKLDVESEGTGVGLALVKRIIEVHGGKVWVESAGEGMGSCFCFTVGLQGHGI